MLLEGDLLLRRRRRAQREPLWLLVGSAGCLIGVLMFSDQTGKPPNGARRRPTAASLLVFLLLFTKRLVKESAATWACLYSVGRLFKAPPSLTSDHDLYDVTNYRLTGSASYGLTGKLSTEQLRHF